MSWGNFGDTLVKQPLPTIQLVLSAILIFSSMITLIGWLSSVQMGDLQVPMILVGLTVIALFVTINNNIAAVLIAIMIIGVIVAPENYLLRITHMMSQPETPVKDYMGDYGAKQEQPATLSPDQLVERIVSDLRARDVQVQEQLKEELGLAISREATEFLSGRVRDEDADFPLGGVVAGGTALENLVQRHGTEDYFIEDMAFLRREGLIQFSDDDYSEAVPTNLGRLVAENIDSREGFTVSPFDRARPAPADMETLNLNESAKFQPLEDEVFWLKFSVSESAEYYLEANSIQNGDPMMRLYGPDEFILVEMDDDSGDGLDSRIERNLAEGRYYLGVRDLGEKGNAIEVKFEKVSGE